MSPFHLANVSGYYLYFVKTRDVWVQFFNGYPSGEYPGKRTDSGQLIPDNDFFCMNVGTSNANFGIKEIWCSEMPITQTEFTNDNKPIGFPNR